METLDSIKVVHQVYHGNVIIGNHPQNILNKYLKLQGAVSDKPEIHKDILLLQQEKSIRNKGKKLINVVRKLKDLTNTTVRSSESNS